MLKKLIIRSILCLFVFTVPSYAKPLQIKQIQSVMKQLFEYHIESKEITPTIAKRMVKIYLEQFDHNNIYLLDEEIYPFIHISSNQADEIAKRLQNSDYSDFKKINALCKNAILRARSYRKEISKELLKIDFTSLKKNFYKDNEDKVLSKKDLFKKMHLFFLQFFLCHEKSLILDTIDRREKLCNLLNKRLQRYEDTYLSSDENYISLHILKAFAKSLDSHSAFFSEDEAGEMRMNLEKQFEGIGVVLTEGIDGVIVSDVIKNGPAEKSNQIAVNDIIVEIDGRLVKDMKFEEFLLAMKPKKKEVVLGLIRINSAKDLTENKPMWKVKLASQPIIMEEDCLSYSYEPYGDKILGVLSLKSFYENKGGLTAEKDIRKAIQKLQKEGDLKGLILDLRDNAGGFLSQAIKVAGIFLSSGVVAISRYSQGEIRYLRCMNVQNPYRGALIILTSKLSASAAEIVAQTLQDYGIAIVIGDSRTFGKGSIQFQTVTDTQSPYFFKVTVGKYYTVSGKSTQINGVQADIVVPTNVSPYPFGERFLENPLPNDRIPSAYKDSLSDLDAITKKWFQINYLPSLQKKQIFWQQYMTILKENSKYRLSKDPNFQEFMKKMNDIKMHIDNKDENLEIGKYNYGSNDLQLQEAKNILKEMIYFQATKQKS